MNRAIALLMLTFGCLQIGASKSDSPHKDEPVQPPSWFVTDLGEQVVDDDTDMGIVSAQGMWYSTSSAKSEQLIAPISVKILCSRTMNTCRESDATMAMGILQSDTTDYEVSLWDKDRIVAEDADEGPCRISHRLVIDFQSRTITLTDLPSQVTSADCKYYRNAKSYILHGGQAMLIPTPTYNPLKQK